MRFRLTKIAPVREARLKRSLSLGRDESLGLRSVLWT